MAVLKSNQRRGGMHDVAALALGFAVQSCGPNTLSGEAGGPCGAGQIRVGDGCTDSSASGSGFFSPGSTDGSESQPGLEETCIDVQVGFERATPTVLLLIDQSSSMDEDFDASDRWTTLKGALLDPVDGVLNAFENRVRFGLMLYSSEGGFEGGECPMLTPAPLVGGAIDFKLGNYRAIVDVFGPADMVGDTPTAESLLAAADALEAVTLPGPKEIILATDGEPDTCEDADAHDQGTNDATIEIVDGIFGRGIGTSVIGVGDEVAEDHLTALANAGRGLGPNGSATYYRPADKRRLAAAFEQIISGVSSCVFNLGGEVESAAAGRVVLDGVELALDEEDGWRLANPSRIELLGDACEDVRLGADLLSISFRCGSFVPIR